MDRVRSIREPHKFPLKSLKNNALGNSPARREILPPVFSISYALPSRSLSCKSCISKRLRTPAQKRGEGGTQFLSPFIFSILRERPCATRPHPPKAMRPPDSSIRKSDHPNRPAAVFDSPTEFRISDFVRRGGFRIHRCGRFCGKHGSSGESAELGDRVPRLAVGFSQRPRVTNHGSRVTPFVVDFEMRLA